MFLHHRAKGGGHSHHSAPSGIGEVKDLEGEPHTTSSVQAAAADATTTTTTIMHFHYSPLDSHARLRWLMTPWEAVRRRSWRGLLVAFVGLVLAVFTILFVYTWSYKWLHSRDPCVVAFESDQRFKSIPRNTPGFKPVLPKIIHQQWKTKDVPPGPMTRYRNKFKKLFPEPEYTYMLWTDESARELIAKEFSFFLETYDSYRFNIQRADATRYFVLYKYGGLYADLDYEPLVNFWEHLPTDRPGFVESPYQFNEYTQNSLMSSPVGDPFWKDAFKVLMERSHLPVLHSTGPSFVDAATAVSKEPVYALPCENFQRYVYWEAAEDDNSPFFSKFGRDFQRLFVPTKYCGDYHDLQCQYGRHHNSVSYFGDTGVLGMALGR